MQASDACAGHKNQRDNESVRAAGKCPAAVSSGADTACHFCCGGGGVNFQIWKRYSWMNKQVLQRLAFKISHIAQDQHANAHRQGGVLTNPVLIKQDSITSRIQLLKTPVLRAFNVEITVLKQN
jgi:hypothetical protein